MKTKIIRVINMAAMLLALGSVDAGVSDGGVAATWKLSTKLGPGQPLRQELISEMTKSGGGVGEGALTKAEAEAFFRHIGMPLIVDGGVKR